MRSCPVSAFERNCLGFLLTLVGCLVLVPGLALADPTTPKPRGFQGFLAVTSDGEVLATHHADRRFAPASVQKLLISAAALHHLGPEDRIHTRVTADGPIVDGTLDGNLVLHAAGDPTWSGRFYAENPRQPLEHLARRVAEAGLRRVTGDLVVRTGAFTGRPFPTSRALGELAYGWAAPVVALAVDENALRVEIAPGPRVGSPGSVRVTGPADADVRLINAIRTVGVERHGHGTVDFLPSWVDQTLVVRGEYPISEPSYTLEVAVPQGELHAAGALRRVLEARGVRIDGSVAIDPRPRTADEGRPLAVVESPPLGERLVPILTDSANWQTEMLLRHLAFRVVGEGRSGAGLEVVADFLTETVGIDAGAFELDDASGISPHDSITPRAVVALLEWSRGQPWFPVFRSALATPGEGTLDTWGRLPPLHGKTGSARGTLGLAGFLAAPGAGPGAQEIFFVHLNNRRPEARPVLRAEIRRWLWELSEGASRGDPEP